MTEPESLTENDPRISRHVFISFASADRTHAQSICGAIEQHGFQCWISLRDVRPGANYQDSIVRSIRDARAMVLIFSAAANRSDEIKKELSLASRYKVPVIALRIDEVEPSDAFAYELSTRQWIDDAIGRDAAICALTAQLGDAALTPPDDHARAEARATRPRARRSRAGIAASAGAALALAAGGGWLWTRPAAAHHSLQVRLAGFQRLSTDVPATMPEAMRDELIAAFGDDGVITVSTAPEAPKGSAPAYALGGTIGRDGPKLKIITRLADERTGTTLWSSTNEAEESQASLLPRRTAIPTSMVVRCGLFGISTYPRDLPEATVGDYFQACQNGDAPDKALDFARKVVAAAPDFSWGWSAVETAVFNILTGHPAEDEARALRREGLSAADKAVKLDRTNSEAFAYKAQLLDPGDLVERGRLLQAAVEARTLPCGCEHHFYGDFLMEVGRVADAITEYRRAIDIMALNSNSQLSLAQALLATDRPDLAQDHIEAALALDDDPRSAGMVKVALAPLTGDFAGAIKVLRDPALGPPPSIGAPLASAFEALISKDRGARTAAVGKLMAMPPETHGSLWILLLTKLGANREALDGTLVAAIDRKRPGARSWLFALPDDGPLRDPDFPSVADRLGLIQYWRTTHTRPDVCRSGHPPAFCKMI